MTTNWASTWWMVTWIGFGCMPDKPAATEFSAPPSAPLVEATPSVTDDVWAVIGGSEDAIGPTADLDHEDRGGTPAYNELVGRIQKEPELYLLALDKLIAELDPTTLGSYYPYVMYPLTCPSARDATLRSADLVLSHYRRAERKESDYDNNRIAQSMILLEREQCAATAVARFSQPSTPNCAPVRDFVADNDRGLGIEWCVDESPDRQLRLVLRRLEQGTLHELWSEPVGSALAVAQIVTDPESRELRVKVEFQSVDGKRVIVLLAPIEYGLAEFSRSPSDAEID